jgi:hypothetical protein
MDKALRLLSVLLFSLFSIACHAQIMQQVVMATPPPAAGGNTPTFVQSKSSGTSNASTLAFTSSVTAGHAIIVGYYTGSGLGQTIVFTDSQPNTFTTLKSAGLSTDQDTIAIGCAIAGSTGSDTISFSVNGSGTFGREVAYEYSGTTCTQDVTAVSLNTQAAASCNSGALTTTTANDLLVAICADDGGQATPMTAGSGWSNAQSAANAGFYFIMSETQLATTPSSYTGTSGALTTAMEQGSILVALKHN